MNHKMSHETQTERKAYKGIAMEGIVAKQYDRIQKHMIEEYKLWAKLVSGNITSGSNVLEVAPGPGYLSVEIAKLGNYNMTGLDISKTFVEIAQRKPEKQELRLISAKAMPLRCLFQMKLLILQSVLLPSKTFQTPLKYWMKYLGF